MAPAKINTRRTITFATAFLFAYQIPALATAGMPTFTLTDVAKVRLSSISFFLLVVLLSAISIRWIWNRTRQDFAWMPLLSIKGAIGAVLLWGLMFVVVLTMISGARELMTPGAWQKNGLTYQLNDARETDAASAEEIAAEVARQLDERSERTAQLQRLFSTITDFANQHNGRLPTNAEFQLFPREQIRTPIGVPARYVFISGDSSDPNASDPVIVLEPDVFADGRQLGLHRSGKIQPVLEREAIR